MRRAALPWSEMHGAEDPRDLTDDRSAGVEPAAGEVRAGPGSVPEGMGPTPSGPEFVPSRRTIPPEGSAAASREAFVAPYRTPRRRLLSAANVITFAVFALVAVVVALASAVAHHDDTHIEAPTPVRVPSIKADTPDQREIEFSTPHGTGKLIMLSRTWQDGGRRPINGSYLEVRVEIICLTGRVGYDPYNFQAFDETGQLFDVDESGVTGHVLGVGELSPGQTVRGAVAFDIPHGEVTLLMSDDSEQSITALKVPD
jgi:hypothetical protein